MKAHALLLAAFFAAHSASAGDFDFELGEDLTSEDIEEAMEEESCDSSLIATQVGRNTFFSDGTVVTKVRRNTFFSDGTVATEVGKNTFISGGDSESLSDAAVLIFGEE